MTFLHSSYIEFLNILNQKDVHYLGIAVNLYGYRRMTQDMDILYQSSPVNVDKLKEAIETFGFDLSHTKNHDFCSSTHLRLGDAPNTIDIINETVGIDYEEAFHTAKIFEIDGLKIPVIHLNELINNKKALNTFKDLADAQQLTEISDKGL